MKKYFLFSSIVFLCLGIITSCDPDPEDTTIPKPRGYFRISLPKHKYKVYDSLCPFTFETPKYSWVVNKLDEGAEPCFLNIYYPRFGAIMHLSYKSVNGDLRQFLQKSDEFAKIHTVKANALNENLVLRDSAKVYGIMYDIGGNAASNVQFYLTDSTKHFIRGALYFSVKPNIDSLQPVLDFLREDVVHMMQTFKWKNDAASIAAAAVPTEKKKVGK